jgi:hypothetical protein
VLRVGSFISRRLGLTDRMPRLGRGQMLSFGGSVDVRRLAQRSVSRLVLVILRSAVLVGS